MRENRLRKTIKRFIYSIDDTVKVRFNEYDGFYYDLEKHFVNIDFMDMTSDGFIEHLKEYHKCNFANKFSVVTWFILHELGHKSTQFEVNWYNDFQKRFYLCLIKDENQSTIEYFNLPSEYKATEWAIWFANTHRELVKEFDLLIRKYSE